MTDSDLRIDFTDVEDQLDFKPIPASKQNVRITDWDQGEVSSDGAKNYGATKISIEYTVQDGDYEGRRIWDTFTIVPASFWKLKAFMKAINEDTDQTYSVDELLELCPDFVGRELVVRLKIQQARKDQKTGQDWPARNQVGGYFPAKESDLP